MGYVTVIDMAALSKDYGFSVSISTTRNGSTVLLLVDSVIICCKIYSIIPFTSGTCPFCDGDKRTFLLFLYFLNLDLAM